MSEKQATATIIIALPFFKKKNSKSRQSLGVYETLLAELQFEHECIHRNYLRMTSENFEETFQLIKDDIRKENTKMS